MTWQSTQHQEWRRSLQGCSDGIPGSFLGWKRWVEDNEVRHERVEFEGFERSPGRSVQVEPEMKVWALAKCCSWDRALSVRWDSEVWMEGPVRSDGEPGLTSTVALWNTSI